MPALRPCVLFLSLLLAGVAQADSLAQLKTRLQQSSLAPLKAQVDVSLLARSGEGKELEEKPGAASVVLEDNAQGLRLSYGRELLSRAEAEERARAADPKAKRPALNGLGALEPQDIRLLIAPAPTLRRLLERATLQSEQASQLNGKPVQLLTLALSREKASGKEAEFVKKYEGSLQLWLDEQGQPLQAKLKEQVSGRAYMVFSFEGQEERDIQFGQVGERLVVLKSESRQQQSGTGGKSERRVTHILKPIA